jgi:hypothetical protein
MEKKRLIQERPLQGEALSNIKSKEMLLEIISDQLTDFWTKVLDFSDVAIGDKQRQQSYRSKVLRVGNDAIRFLGKEISRKFIVDYVAINEDIVRVRPSIPAKRVITTKNGSHVEVETKSELPLP